MAHRLRIGILYVLSAAMLTVLIGCAGIDPDAAKSLGTAGQGAAQAIYDQANASAATLTELPALIVVRDDLLCTATTNHVTGRAAGATLSNCLNNLIDPKTKLPALQAEEGKQATALASIVQKRANAASQLEAAYTSYVALATYDAGAQATAAMSSAFASINELSKTISVAYPPASVASVITPTITSTTSGIVGFVAYERQRALLLSASHDLGTATNALLTDLNAEAEYATGIMEVLAAERSTVYGAYIQAGLVSAPQVLQAALSDVAPGVTTISNPPVANAPAIASAAQHYVMMQTQQKIAAISQSYQAAVAALKAVVIQQQQLASKSPLDIQSIWIQVQELQALTKLAKAS